VKNFENRLAFGKVGAKNIVATFSTHGVDVPLLQYFEEIIPLPITYLVSGIFFAGVS